MIGRALHHGVALEPPGGNVYRAHRLMVDSGTFWRCAHGVTGFGERLAWLGCPGCAADDPDAAARWTQDLHGPAVAHEPMCLDAQSRRACTFWPFNTGDGWRWGACVDCGSSHPSERA